MMIPQIFFYPSRLLFQFNSLIRHYHQVQRGIPPPGRGIVGKNRNTRSKTTLGSFCIVQEAHCYCGEVDLIDDFTHCNYISIDIHWKYGCYHVIVCEVCPKGVLTFRHVVSACCVLTFMSVLQ